MLDKIKIKDVISRIELDFMINYCKFLTSPVITENLNLLIDIISYTYNKDAKEVEEKLIEYYHYSPEQEDIKLLIKNIY